MNSLTVRRALPSRAIAEGPVRFQAEMRFFGVGRYSEKDD